MASRQRSFEFFLADQCAMFQAPTMIVSVMRGEHFFVEAEDLARAPVALDMGQHLPAVRMKLRQEILQLTRASGVAHPGLLSGDMIEILDGRFGSATLTELFGYQTEWGFPSEADRREIVQVMEGGTPA